jgi:prolyl-tRNA editing enzyme YbaK/EbsC (Cys-tRNA(Pro) deacylase)
MNATGYQFGGTSPFGLRKQLPVFIERSIFDLKEIYINGGKRGYIIKIKTEDFGKVFNFETVEVAI